MKQIFEYSDLSTCFYTLLELSTKYDHCYGQSQMSQVLAKCLLKISKKIQDNISNLNVERIILMLHRYCLRYSVNMVKFSQGKLYL